MSVFLKTIKTTNEGVETAEIVKYPDEITGAIFYHSKLNTEIRAVSEGTQKSVYCALENASGVTLKAERWEKPEPAPAPEENGGE